MTGGIVVRELYDSIEQVGGVLLDTEMRAQNVNYAEELEAFLPVIAAGEAMAFASQSTPDGSPWAPLAPSTVAKKGHSRILFESGALEASLVNVGGPGNINATACRGLLFGTDVEYAIFHQQGTARMPARPAVGMSEETVDKLAETIADATVEKMKFGGN